MGVMDTAGQCPQGQQVPQAWGTHPPSKEGVPHIGETACSVQTGEGV